MAGNVHAGFSLKLRGRIREQNTAQIREGLYSSITKSLLKIRYSWLHLSAEWCSAAFPGSIPAHQACRDLLAGFNTIITWGKCRVHLVLLWHLPSPLGSPRSSRHSGNRRGSHLESQGLRNYLLSLARSLHKLQERGKKTIRKKWLWKTSGSTKPSAHGCCVQVGGWYSNSAHSWYWPKVIDHLRSSHQRGHETFVRISATDDDQCKHTDKQLLKKHPSPFIFLPHTSTSRFSWGISHSLMKCKVLPPPHLTTPHCCQQICFPFTANCSMKFSLDIIVNCLFWA